MQKVSRGTSENPRSRDRNTCAQDIVVAQLLVKRIPAERILGFNQYGKIGMVGHRFTGIAQAANTFDTSQLLDGNWRQFPCDVQVPGQYV